MKTNELFLRFTADTASSPIRVALVGPDGRPQTPPAPFEPPLGDTELDGLRWYLEVFGRWPAGPALERARGVEKRLTDWGQRLWNSVVQKGAWPQKSRIGQVTIEADDPRVLRMPWEMLADRHGPLAARGIGIRRTVEGTKPRYEPSSLPARVLLLTPRPQEVRFTDPRAAALPLAKALDDLEGKVVIEGLAPPTLQTLSERLQAASPIHIIFFDGYALYDTSLGLGYLLMENERQEAEWVDAPRLGKLLHQHRVPLVVIHACQGAMQQETNPYTTVALQLVREGVGNVLLLTHILSPGATRRFFTPFLQGLTNGETVGRAVSLGRKGLTAQGEKRLADWFVPTLYQQPTDPSLFTPPPSPLPSPLLPRALTDPTTPGGSPPAPPHGFHGRGRAILRLERAVAEYPILFLHGPEGIGKTALAAEFARWLYRTGRFPGGVAFVSLREAGSLSHICASTVRALSDDPAAPLDETDPIAQVDRLLNEQPALLILDGVETVLGPEPSIPPEERLAILDAVWGWMGRGARRSPSRVLMTSRTAAPEEGWLGRGSRACASIELAGLDGEEGLMLAAALLDAHTIDRGRVDPKSLIHLLNNLGGHPLAIYLVLPYLRYYTLPELADHLEEISPGFAAGTAQPGEQALNLALEFFIRRTDDRTRAVLMDLAVFQVGATESRILDVTQADPDLWRSVRQELELAALINVETLDPQAPPFLRFSPALLAYLNQHLPPSRRKELEVRYREGYYRFGNLLYRADTQNPLQARKTALRELGNLRQAFHLASANHLEEAASLSDILVHFLDAFGLWWEREAVMEELAALQATSQEELTRAEYLVLSMRGEALLQQGRAEEAERLFRTLLRRLETSPVYDAPFEHAYTVWNLGRSLTEQERAVPAIRFQKKALAEFEKQAEFSRSAAKMIAACHTDWANNLVTLHQFDQAQTHYEQALTVFREMNDLRSIGIVSNRLGRLSLARGTLDEASRWYTKALDTFRALDEPREVAAQWHRLGEVAQEAGDWSEAERCYQEAVYLRENLRDLAGLAETYDHLTLALEQAGRPQKAEEYYLRAIQILREMRELDAQIELLTRLALLYIILGRQGEAARCAQEALEVRKVLGYPQSGPEYARLVEMARSR